MQTDCDEDCDDQESLPKQRVKIKTSDDEDEKGVATATTGTTTQPATASTPMSNIFADQTQNLPSTNAADIVMRADLAKDRKRQILLKRREAAKAKREAAEAREEETKLELELMELED